MSTVGEKPKVTVGELNDFQKSVRVKMINEAKDVPDLKYRIMRLPELQGSIK